jgi:FkbM family methyltransferase
VLDNLKQMMIRTPLERPLHRLRYLAGFRHRRKHPELAELFIESDRIEEMLTRLLKKDSNCLDVGCHLGSFLSMLLRLAPQGKHMAFEALPEKAARLKRKFADVQVIHSAVGDAKGEITFFNDLTHAGYSSMNRPVNKDDRVEVLKVPCDTLDHLVPADRHVDFMKMDVEGAELLVLKGAQQLIARCKPVILFECAPAGLKEAKVTAEEIFGHIENALGYRVYLIKDWMSNGAPLSIEQFKKAMAYPALGRNFVASPAERTCPPSTSN